MKQINLIINMPTTAEGLEQLAAAMQKFNTRVVEAVLRQADATEAAKAAYLKSLNGAAPWAVK